MQSYPVAGSVEDLNTTPSGPNRSLSRRLFEDLVDNANDFLDLALLQSLLQEATSDVTFRENMYLQGQVGRPT